MDLVRSFKWPCKTRQLTLLDHSRTYILDRLKMQDLDLAPENESNTPVTVVRRKLHSHDGVEKDGPRPSCIRRCLRCGCTFYAEQRKRMRCPRCGSTVKQPEPEPVRPDPESTLQSAPVVEGGKQVRNGSKKSSGSSRSADAAVAVLVVRNPVGISVEGRKKVISSHTFKCDIDAAVAVLKVTGGDSLSANVSSINTLWHCIHYLQNLLRVISGGWHQLLASAMSCAQIALARSITTWSVYSRALAAGEANEASALCSQCRRPMPRPSSTTGCSCWICGDWCCSTICQRKHQGSVHPVEDTMEPLVGM
jgi:ribosomal protein S27AE